jgi:hypothetical protein
MQSYVSDIQRFNYTALKKESLLSPETLAHSQKSTWRNNHEDHNFFSPASLALCNKLNALHGYNNAHNYLILQSGSAFVST